MGDKSQASQWWRWIALAPGAVLAGAAAGAAMHAFQWLSTMFNWGSPEGWYFRFVVPVMVSGAAGYAYARAACLIAPSGKRIAGTVMVTILGVTCLIGAVAGWIIPSYSTGHAVLSTVSAIAMMGAAIAAVAEVRL